MGNKFTDAVESIWNIKEKVDQAETAVDMGKDAKDFLGKDHDASNEAAISIGFSPLRFIGDGELHKAGKKSVTDLKKLLELYQHEYMAGLEDGTIDQSQYPSAVEWGRYREKEKQKNIELENNTHENKNNITSNSNTNKQKNDSHKSSPSREEGLASIHNNGNATGTIELRNVTIMDKDGHFREEVIAVIPYDKNKKNDFKNIAESLKKLVPLVGNPLLWSSISSGSWYDLFRDAIAKVYDPLTLDLDGNGIETLASNGHKGALFDHDKNGIRTATGWVGKDDGFLVYDRNGDGVVNDGGELFGDNTLLKNGERATNGYQALADLDDNGDGKVDAADSAFAKLRVWRDLNQDGISQQGELLTLDEARVKALNLTNKNSNRDLGNGNSLAEEGTYTDSDGNKKQMGDLNLAADHFHSRYADSLPLTDEQQQAPNLRGSGRVRDLREAAARSPELAEALQQYKNAATKEEQLTLRHENTAMTPGKPCHEYAEKDRLKALQGCNKSVQFPQNTTQTPHNNTWICRNNQHSRTSHDKPTDQYRPQAAASCSVSCLWYCPTLGLQ